MPCIVQTPGMSPVRASRLTSHRSGCGHSSCADLSAVLSCTLTAYTHGLMGNIPRLICCSLACTRPLTCRISRTSHGGEADTRRPGLPAQPSVCCTLSSFARPNSHPLSRAGYAHQRRSTIVQTRTPPSSRAVPQSCDRHRSELSVDQRGACPSRSRRCSLSGSCWTEAEKSWSLCCAAASAARRNRASMGNGLGR